MSIVAESGWTPFPPRPVGDGKLRLHLLEIPEMDAGAPKPAIAADEHCLVFAYERSDGGQAPQQNVAVVRCDSCLAIKWGPPNDEALDGHPHYEAGLGYYGVFEVTDSDWVMELERQNSVHSKHVPGLFSGYRHFIVTFKDSTLEFLAKEPDFRLTAGSPVEAALRAFEEETES